MPAMTTQRIIVHGRVQGVNFRSFVVEEANRLNLDGWVRNRSDGTVEALFSGRDTDVMAAIAACRTGPRYADVTEVDVYPAGESDLKLRREGEKFSRLI
jgi:acylphosphatase